MPDSVTEGFLIANVSSDESLQGPKDADSRDGRALERKAIIQERSAN